METNTTENYDLFQTVHSHTFHDLSPSTEYSVTITAVNKAGSGPPVSMNVTTQEHKEDGGKTHIYLYIIKSLVTLSSSCSRINAINC